jgi:hypothetical protein
MELSPEVGEMRASAIVERRKRGAFLSERRASGIPGTGRRKKSPEERRASPRKERKEDEPGERRQNEKSAENCADLNRKLKSAMNDDREERTKSLENPEIKATEERQGRRSQSTGNETPEEERKANPPHARAVLGPRKPTAKTLHPELGTLNTWLPVMLPMKKCSRNEYVT